MSDAPKFWQCPVHGPAKANAWGCPECVRELRGERTVLARWIAEALLVLSTLDEDSEDGGESLRMLRDRGDRLVKAVLHG